MPRRMLSPVLSALSEPFFKNINLDVIVERNVITTNATVITFTTEVSLFVKSTVEESISSYITIRDFK